MESLIGFTKVSANAVKKVMLNITTHIIMMSVEDTERKGNFEIFFDRSLHH